MKIHLRILFSTLLLFFLSTPIFSQDLPPRTDKFYSMSGFGFSFPIGGSTDFMRPKFSTTIGANIGLGPGNGNGGIFLYPKFSLHVFGYDNIETDQEFNYELEKGRSTTYLLTVGFGYRKILGNVAFYGYLNGGGGFILTPRLAVSQGTKIAVLNNKTNHMGIIEPGAGIEYNIGGANLFMETSYMHGLGDVGGRPFNAIPLTIGIKPNLSRLFNKKKP
ncbi:MAG: hypothetical protein ABWY16_05740 [Pedobacter sp.]|uniref:hypothetical protein n=1 Tax=Pedobacter sp. TaxID=1411316 RepID=UPI003394353E